MVFGMNLAVSDSSVDALDIKKMDQDISDIDTLELGRSMRMLIDVRLLGVCHAL